MSEYFTQTSDGLYDRHVYKLNIPKRKSVILEDYETLRRVWFESIRNCTGCTVEVLDSKQNNKKNIGGFK